MVSKFCTVLREAEVWADDVDTVRYTTDWEDDFEAVGIAKCCQCGLRLPIDQESIELHSRSCGQAVITPRMDPPKSPTCGSKEWFAAPWHNRNSDAEGAETTCYSSGLEEESGVISRLGEATSTDDAALPCVSYDQVTNEDEDPSYLQDTGMDAWEDGFDAIGVCKCSHCGAKLPLDDEAVDRHLRECKARVADAAVEHEPQFGTCCRCQQRISLDPEAVIAHSQMCLASSAPPPAPPPPPPQEKRSAPQKGCNPGRPMPVSCFHANSSLFGSPASSDVLSRCDVVTEDDGGANVEPASILSSWNTWRKRHSL